MLSWGGQSGPEWFLYPHTMDLIRWLFQREPVEVYAKGTRGVLDGRGIPCWDTIQTLIEFEGGAICTFETSWIVPDSFTNVVDNRITVYGDRGGLEIKNEPSLWAFTDRFHTPFSSTAVDALRQGVGLPVRADPLLRRLRRPGHHARRAPAATASW